MGAADPDAPPIYSHYEDESLHVFVGDPPAPLASHLCEVAGGSVLGGLQTAEITLAIIETPAAELEVVRLCESQLTKAGWARRIAATDPVGGFRTDGHNGQLWYCHSGTQRVIGLVASRVASRTVVKFALAEPSYVAICGVESRTPQLDPELSKPSLPIPDLLPPDDAELPKFASTRGSWSDDHWEGGLALRTSLDTAALLDHYARQLQASGWSLGQRAQLSEAGLQLLTATDPQGRSRIATLAATRFASASDPYRVWIEIDRLGK
jgi:hypothetical protein